MFAHLRRRRIAARMAREQDKVIVKAMRRRYPGASRAQCRAWHAEDVAFAQFSDRVFDAAQRGVSVSFLNSCPDLHELARQTYRE